MMLLDFISYLIIKKNNKILLNNIMILYNTEIYLNSFQERMSVNKPSFNWFINLNHSIPNLLLNKVFLYQEGNNISHSN